MQTSTGTIENIIFSQLMLMRGVIDFELSTGISQNRTFCLNLLHFRNHKWKGKIYQCLNTFNFFKLKPQLPFIHLTNFLQAHYPSYVYTDFRENCVIISSWFCFSETHMDIAISLSYLLVLWKTKSFSF